MAQIWTEMPGLNGSVLGGNQHTHDYVLLKWFDLLMDKGKGDHVRFHALYRDPEQDGVMVDSVEDYRSLSPNAISETFNDLTKEQVNRKMGGLGK